VFYVREEPHRIRFFSFFFSRHLGCRRNEKNEEKNFLLLLSTRKCTKNKYTRKKKKMLTASKITGGGGNVLKGRFYCRRCFFSRRGRGFAVSSSSSSSSSLSSSSSSGKQRQEQQQQQQRYSWRTTTTTTTTNWRQKGRRRTGRIGFGDDRCIADSARRKKAVFVSSFSSSSSSADAALREFKTCTEKPSQTGQIAKLLAETVVRGGDVICLHGTVGAGKSLFARAFIRSVLNEGLNLSVTSPTYLIQNTYEKAEEDESGVRKVHHFDLYRLPDERSVQQLIDLEDTFSKTSVSVFEWPDRLGSLIEKAENRVDVYISASAGERSNADESDFENKFGPVREAHLLALDDESEEEEDEEDKEEDGDDEYDDDYVSTQTEQTIRTIEFKPVGASITQRFEESLFSTRLNK